MGSVSGPDTCLRFYLPAVLHLAGRGRYSTPGSVQETAKLGDAELDDSAHMRNRLQGTNL